MQTLTILSCGRSDRLERLLAGLPALTCAQRVEAAEIGKHDLRGRRLLFTVAVDALGEDAALCELIRFLRARPDCLRGATAAVIVDGATELDTKDIARRLIFAANRAGCAFLDAEGVAEFNRLDCMHLTRRGHACLAERLASLVPGLLA